MLTRPHHRPDPKLSRAAKWARFWLVCLGVLLNCGNGLLPPSLARRLPILSLPRVVLARFAARLIFLCAAAQATRPRAVTHGHRNRFARPPNIRALLRTGAQGFLTNSRGELDVAAIAHTCAHPQAAIAHMISALERGLTRRNPILPCAAFEALNTIAPTHDTFACDTS